MSEGKVKNLSDHVVDIAPDGRVIAPGEAAENVDLTDDHNKALLDSGALLNIEEEESKSTGKGGDK